MNTSIKKGVWGVIMAITAGSTHAETEHASIVEALSATEVSSMFRLRYEGVDQDGVDNNATATTLLGRLTAKTGNYGKWSAVAEFDYVAHPFDDNFNDTVNGNTNYPVVADPSGADLNQVYLKYGMSDGSAVTFGRQRINHNNQRFVGGVAWRQNEQTFDALRIQSKLGGNVKLDYAYAYRVNRIFGDNHPLGDVSGNIHLLNANYAIAKGHALTGYVYHLDFDELSALSTNTSGVEYTFNNDKGLALHLGYASQTDAGDNAVEFDSDYWVFDVTYQIGQVSVSAGYEELGSDNGKGFSTPLATLHKFQGWTDKFLTTPGNGLQDTWVKVAGSIGKVPVAVVYHQFESDVGGQDFGEEIGVLAKYKLNSTVNFLGKYARYSADEHASDTSKFWFQAVAKF